MSARWIVIKHLKTYQSTFNKFAMQFNNSYATIIKTIEYGMECGLHSSHLSKGLSDLKLDGT